MSISQRTSHLAYRKARSASSSTDCTLHWSRVILRPQDNRASCHGKRFPNLMQTLPLHLLAAFAVTTRSNSAISNGHTLTQNPLRIPSDFHSGPGSQTRFAQENFRNVRKALPFLSSLLPYSAPLLFQKLPQIHRHLQIFVLSFSLQTISLLRFAGWLHSAKQKKTTTLLSRILRLISAALGDGQWDPASR
jgi:hypothetical protein